MSESVMQNLTNLKMLSQCAWNEHLIYYARSCAWILLINAQCVRHKMAFKSWCKLTELGNHKAAKILMT